MAINCPNNWENKGDSMVQELVNEKNGEISETLDIPQELRYFRELWKEKFMIDDETKEKIVKATEKIPINIETDKDWSKLIEFKLWSKTYRILDPKLESHTDDEYRKHVNQDSITKINQDYVKLWWMNRSNIHYWQNKKLKEYIMWKEEKWLHIANLEDLEKLLNDLILFANIGGKKNGIAMLMYLTGMDWWYWLEKDYNKRVEDDERPRFVLNCHIANCSFSKFTADNCGANVCMISCE